MQHLAVSLIFALCLVCSAAGEAAYIIRLKNGNEFVTGRYWHEGRQIMFDIYGGVFGVNKDFITKIERSDKTVKIETTVQMVSKDKAEEIIKKDDSETKTPSATTDVKTGNDPISREFNVLREKFKTVDKMLTNELSTFTQELTAFRNKILASGNAKAYMQEFSAATDMGNTVEATLKSKTQ